ncbi:WXG100 family type VII secretion target [Amycolatopsis sp. WQ 127309]|uniref:WXG100 family type VII secretion target n=1 Tax=Amycolatopsis sp. WQ 127309 TaxID=2932773 RepID=UPI001FF39169|nr:WXG100 family type VII secretion target [Amycolatopsis sp. WQ 127309]UOZ06911.1 WXG100 family type VII secretion target [Amycolatopsis sp. WQ 127309]
MSQLDLDESNWATGAGIIDTGNFLASSIRNEQDHDRTVVAAQIGIAAGTLVLDVASVALDPLGKLFAAGVGWLIEHVHFLRIPLDMLAGNPPEIRLMAEQLHKQAENVRNAAADLTARTRRVTDEWQGEAAESFTHTTDSLLDRMGKSGEALDTAGYVVETTMAVIAALRALIRDIIASVIGEILAIMVVALATASLTFGASIVVGTIRCIACAVTATVRMLSKVTKARGLSERAAHRLERLTASGARRDDAVVYRDWLQEYQHYDSVPVPAVPPVVSPLRKFEVPVLKTHERWLNGHGFADARTKSRFVENWLREHHPEYFRIAKTMSDAKSSLNYVGLADKAAITLGRQLTDIREQAEAAWAESDEQAGDGQSP